MKFRIGSAVRIIFPFALLAVSLPPRESTIKNRPALASPPVRLLWQDTATGERSVWLMNGTSWNGNAVILPQVPAQWSIVGAGDFNADGYGDILWQNAVTGDRSIWLMNDTTYQGQFVLLPKVPTAWSIAGVGDFNGDDNPDIVWQNTSTGERSVWLMNGTSAKSYVMLPQVSTDWSIAAIADFNADGKPDLVWQNLVTGERSIWLMNGATWSGSYASLPTEPTQWRIVAATDFDGDGKPDLVWQNTATGERSVWLMNGTTWGGQAVQLQTVSTDWSIAGVLAPIGAVGFSDAAMPSDLAARGSCLTISLAPSIAAECGDLRIVHELPSVRTYSRTRSPTLVYNSQEASPHPIVPVNVSLRRFPTQPTSVVATLRVNGVARANGVWQGSSWPNAQTVRLALAYDAHADSTSLYRYAMQVIANYGASADTSTVTGNLATVNRSTSAFGAGWWIAGLEQLSLDPAGEPAMWIGGDGDVRHYLKKDSLIWVAPSIDRPDTLKRNGSGYVRVLEGGATVRFDSLGRHVATRNRLGHETTFGYDAAGHLNHITVPLAPADYQFFYSVGGQLDSAKAPSNPGQPRKLTVFRVAARIDSLADPDSTRVRFLYPNSISDLVAARKDRRGATVAVSYDSVQKVVASNLRLSITDSIHTAIRPEESLGLNVGGAGAVDTAVAYTRIDGPRTDVADTTLLWVDKFGSPTRIRDAGGAMTTVSRTDSRFPALVTRVVDPAGMITEAVYDARGNPSSVTTRSPYGDARNAVTSYTWDQTWDEVTSITMPEGDVTTFGYDPANGNRLWEQQGTSSARRVAFSYGNSFGLPSSVVIPDIAGRDSIEYDSRGNSSATMTASGFRTAYYADLIGRDTLRIDPIDAEHSSHEHITYDLAGRVKTSTSFGPEMPKTPAFQVRPAVADSVIVTNTYDAEGNLLQVSRSRGVLYPGYAPISSYYEYDSAGRKISQNLFGAAERYDYDPAGNVVRQITPRSDSIVMLYDASNRLIQRAVPRVTYSSTWCGSFIDGPCSFSYPEREGPNLCIAADTSSFAYDASGRMIRADNGSARVRRTYFPNGALKTDSSRLATYAAPCAPMPTDDAFLWHAYGLAFTYDLDGRRATTTHPNQYCSSTGCMERYAYDRDNSALDTLVDARGNLHTFTYDLAGRLTHRSTPGNVVDEYDYDPESNLSSHFVHGPGTTDYLSDGAQYDERGKMISAHTESPLGSADLVLSYSGLGALTAYEQQGNIGGFSAEEFIVDALGNRSERRQTSNDYDPGDAERHRTFHYNAWNQLDAIQGDPQAPPYNNYYAESYVYDGAGNTTLFHKNTNLVGGGGDVTLNDRAGVHGALTVAGPSAEDEPVERGASGDVYHQDSHISYYGADNKLRVFNRHIGVGSASADSLYGERGVFEEYRYDALSRRIFERTRRIGAGCPGTLDCSSRATRTVWDGDRILYEIRSPGGEVVRNDPPPDSTVEVTAPTHGGGPRASQVFSGSPKLTSASADTIPDPGIEGEAAVIGYTHAPGISGIDEPIELRANGTSIFPHTGWRDMLAMGTYANGAASDCAVANPCDRIDWPAANVTIDRGGYARNNEPTVWYGSLASAGSEASGMQYMRNRYYDPKRGQFTQADPIGLGGGMNLYGFGSGDPVNFSDPFGLLECNKKTGEGCSDEYKRLLSIDKPLEAPLVDPVMLASGGLAEGIVDGLAAKAATTSVFWSGEGAKAAAGKWAASNGGKTLGMTKAGQAVARATNDMDFLAARPQWLRASINFAEEAIGDVHVFQSAKGVSLGSVWRDEFKALMANPTVTNIIFHIVP